MSKRKRVKRSHLRTYAAHVTRVPRTANQDIINSYHARVASVQGRKDRVEPIAGNTFTQVIPETRGLQDASEDYVIEHDKAGNPIEVKTPPPVRQAKPPAMDLVQKLHALYQTDWRQGIDDFHFVVRAKTADHTLKLFFSGSRYCWVYEAIGYAKRSAIYNSLNAAEAAFQTKIQYLEVWTLPSPPE